MKKNFSGALNFEYLCLDISNPELTDLSMESIDGGFWEDSDLINNYDDWQILEGIYHITSEKGHDFYIECEQYRCRYYGYKLPSLSFLKKEEYELPTILYEFEYKNYVIICGRPYDCESEKDEYAAIKNVENVVFKKVADAIKYIDSLDVN